MTRVVRAASAKEITFYGMSEYPLIEKEVKRMVKKFPKGISWLELGKNFDSMGIGLGSSHKFKNTSNSALRVYGKNKDIKELVSKLQGKLEELELVPR